MKILTEREQLEKRIAELDSLINYHHLPLKIAQRRYEIKDKWLVSFWIVSPVSTLKYVYDNESNVHDQLYDYRDLLRKERNNLD